MPSLLHGQAETGRHRRSGRALRAPLRRPQGQEVAAADPARRAALLAAKLRALVAGQWGAGDDEPGAFPGGAALRRGSSAFVLAEDGPERALGSALVWCLRHDCDQLRLLVPSGGAGPALARRATAFRPPIEVWEADGRDLSQADAMVQVPPTRATVADRSWLPVLAAEGLEAVEEWGTVSGDVLGLEVARVVDGELHVGVGKNDRWAHAELGSTDLGSVVAMVRSHRTPGSVHQLATLGRERWLRSVLVAGPDVLEQGPLTPVAPARPRTNLQEPSPAPATSEGAVVVCSVGVDLDLVPAAADAAALHGRERVVVVVPEGDDHRVTRDLAAALRMPTEVRTVSPDWAALYPG